MEHELSGIGKPGISDTGWYQSGSNGITCYLLNFDSRGVRFLRQEHIEILYSF